LRTISLLLREDWGALQRVLQLMTKKRVRPETVLSGRCEVPGHSRVFIASADARLPGLVEHLRKLSDVVEAEMTESPAREFAFVRTFEERLPLPQTMDYAAARALASGPKVTMMEKGA